MSGGVRARFLVEGLVRADGTASLAEVYDVGNALGIPDQPLRLTLRRLVAAGEFTQEGRGRAGVLRRTAPADLTERHDVEFVRFAARRDAGLEPWDGVWHLLVFSVPERERAARDEIRRTLLRLGGAALHPGVYVSPNDWGDVAASELGALGTLWTAGTRDLRHGEIGDPVELAARLWPLGEIAARYEPLARLAAAAPPGPATGHAGRVALLRQALELADAFDHALAPDPLLPPELLPRPWPPVAARAAFRSAWEALAAAAGGDGLRVFRRYEDG